MRSRPTSKRLRSVIVEDHRMFRELVGALLEAENLLEVAAVANSAREGIEACRRLRPDILLLDLALPDRNGIAVARALAKCHPTARTIIVSGEADTFLCPPSLQRHIYSIVDKTHAFSVLRKEIADLVRQLTGAESAAPGDTGALSPRELEIYRLVGLGLTSKEIAARIFTSRHTVDTHRRKIAAKMGLGASALVQRAVVHNLVATANQSER
jgi:DNA-binding NarL/FixJ family response regulator